MKKHIKRLLVTGMMVMGSMSVYSQDPPPPPGQGHGQTTNQIPGGGTSVESGLAILLTLTAGYTVRKMWKQRNRLAE